MSIGHTRKVVMALILPAMIVAAVITVFAQPPGGTLIAASGDGGTTRVKWVAYNAYTTWHARDSQLQIVPEYLIGFGWNRNLSFDDSSWTIAVPAGASAMNVWNSTGWLNTVPPGAQVMCESSGCGGTTNTFAYRRKFQVVVPAGKALSHVYLYMWSDNKSAWYINGTRVAYDDEGYIPPVDITGQVTTGGSDNLLAVQVSNDHDDPTGLAWSIYAVFLDMPSIRVNVKNPQGTPVAVSQVCYGAGNGAYATPIACQPNNSNISGYIDTTKNYNGGIINPGTGLRVIGVTPVPGGGHYSTTWGGYGTRAYYWNTWASGENVVDFIVGTPTPTLTPTSTPSIRVNAINPQGTPVAVQSLCAAEGYAYYQHLYGCTSNGSTYTAAIDTSPFSAPRHGGIVNPYANQVVLGATPVPGGGNYSYLWGRGHPSYYWSQWTSGEHIVNFVLATMTPTATPNSTATPTPTPTDTPTPTSTPTPTNTPTPTSTPTPTATPAPGGLILDRDYPYLVLYAPDVGQSAQTLRGQLQGFGAANRAITIQVQAPDSNIYSYTVVTDGTGNFILDPATAGDPYFGVRQTGTWYAIAVYSPTGLSSGTVSWIVDWKPGHLND